MCKTRAASTHPRNAEPAASLQSLQHVKSGLLSTLEKNGVAPLKKAFLHATLLLPPGRSLDQVDQFQRKHLAEPTKTSSSLQKATVVLLRELHSRKWRDEKKARERELAGRNTTEPGILASSIPALKH